MVSPAASSYHCTICIPQQIQFISPYPMDISLLYGSYVIFSLVLLCGVVLVVGVFNLEYYTVVPSVPCTKIALLGKVLHPQQSVHSLVHSMMGIMVTWCAATMIGGRYWILAAPCSEEEGVTGQKMCLNEYYLFFLLAGAFMGYSYSLLGVVRNMNYVSFQTIQQCKYLRFKGMLPQVVRYSAVQSLYSVRNYCLFYFFFGYIPRAWICTTLNVHEDSSDCLLLYTKHSSLHRLDTVSGLLDFRLLYHLWLSGTFLLLTWHITLLLFRIFITEAYSFPVQSSFSEDVSQCLPKVLSEKQPLILKFLALQDLFLLSQQSLSRRMEVFSLSQPGGHPHNWNAICKECLSLLSDLSQRLVEYQEVVASNGRARPLSSHSDQRSTSSETLVTSGTEEQLQTPQQSIGLKTPSSVFLRSTSLGLHTPMTAPFTPRQESPFSSSSVNRFVGNVDPSSPWYGSVQSPHVMRRGPKLWTASTGSPPGSSLPPSPTTIPSPVPAAQKPGLFSLWLQNRQEQVKNFLARRVLIMYLFNKLPEASSQALFADSQAHIWALEGLSNLVAASYKEDRFGVVQTMLPSILSTMLLLQEAVDKHFKLPHASSKPVRSTCCLEDSTFKTLRFALRAALKTAMYRITVTFGEHLHSVQMSAEHRKRLQQFMEYKE
ncbi:nucleoporin NDC1-like [Scleropages formosus]|uniref:Nucleoporin NDC1 n=1 Tax=Scleropages formosus TaxID=113540 RepID=A0A0P7XM42_SCLFO|nr:nucleoporin NDC1-like [Scleropages formosus]